MQENIVKTIDLYDYDAAVRRYEEERHHAWLCRQKQLQAIRQEQRDRRTYYLNQKLIGFLFFCASILLAITVDLVCVAGIIPAVAMIFTKKMVIVNDYWWRHNGAEQWEV